PGGSDQRGNRQGRRECGGAGGSRVREPRIIGQPEPGYWMVRLVRGGPEVPACIALMTVADEPGNPREDRSSYLAAFIGGEPVALSDVWERKGRPVTEAEYRFQLADAAWAKAHAPQEPKADPTRKIDLTALRPIF